MGEIAEMILEGLLCNGCGVYMPDYDSPGYPRWCKDGRKELKINQPKTKNKKKNRKKVKK